MNAFPPERPTASFPYRVESRIGEGSMGVVYRAVESVLERTVAIKVLRPGLLSAASEEEGREYRLRFVQEARAAAALSHSSATTIFRIGEEDGQPYIVMEWLQGRSLEEILEAEGRIEPARLVPWVVQLLGALDAAHQAGIVHRDVKPANLMILGGDRLKVTDFGIARIIGNDLVKTQAGFVFATPRYAAPEQLVGREVDGRCDLFAVGIVLYRALTGRLPFGGDDFAAHARALLYDEPTSLATLVPGLPTSLVEVVRKALEKTPERRFQSASEMAQALRSVSTPMDVTQALAAPPATVSRTLRVDLSDPARAAVEVAGSWTPRPLGKQRVQDLVERLLEMPFHAPPFAGAALFGEACLFVADGEVVAACAGERRGDEVLEGLAKESKVVLHTAPAEPGSDAASTVRSVASLLEPSNQRYSDLDSSFVNLPALGERLRQESFSGRLCLSREGGKAQILFLDGAERQRLVDGEWPGLQLDRPWQEWVTAFVVRAEVHEAQTTILAANLRRRYESVRLLVESRGSGRDDGGPRFLLEQGGLGLNTSGDEIGASPAYGLLRWALGDLRREFDERGRTARWRYLVEWLELVRSARLHHPLQRSTGERDYFDLVTYDEGERVLHVASWSATGRIEALEEFIEHAIAAKTDRLKSGDIGGAIFVTPKLSPELIERCQVEKGLGSSGRWLAVEESFTGYEGFVRVGPRRGFHLLLVEDREQQYRPILP